MVGHRIGNYRVIRQLGEGGMGVVYEGVRDDIGGHAAIKVLRPEFARNPETAARFFNEARAANLIDHPSIVKIFDYGQLPTGAPYLAMEMLKGESLFHRLHRERRLSEPDTIRLGRQVAAALAAAHLKEVIHRDLKPENIFIVPDAEAMGGERAKILDFGIAKLSRGHTGSVRTHTNVVMGTPIYMSPEQCKGGKHVDGRADVYALGVIIFEMMVGQPPFVAEEAGEYIGMHLFKAPPALNSAMPSVSPELNKIVERMLLKEPQARPTMAVVASALKMMGNLTSEGIPIGMAAADGVMLKVGQSKPGPLRARPLLDVKSIASQMPAPVPTPDDDSSIGDTLRFDKPSKELLGAIGFTPAPPAPMRAPPPAMAPPPRMLAPEVNPPLNAVASPRPGPQAAIAPTLRPVSPPAPARSGNPKPASLPPDWQPVEVTAAPPELLGSLDAESSGIGDPSRRGRSLDKQLRRFRYQLKQRLYKLLGIPFNDQRKTPSGTMLTRQRNAVLIGALAVAAGTCVIVLLAWPNPEPEDVSTRSAPSQPVPPELSQALSAVQKAEETSGDISSALNTALVAVKKYNHPAGWSAIGQYACQAGKLKVANQALDHLTDNTPDTHRARADLLRICRESDVVIDREQHLIPAK